MLKQKYQLILEKCRPFVIANPISLTDFSLNFIGVELDERHKYSCLSVNNAELIQLIQNLDKLSFGAQAMAMDKWVIFDCAAMPGAILGFGISKEELAITDPDYLALLNVPDSYHGLVPVSFYMAIPTLQQDHWFGHNLSSMGSRLSTPLPGLGLLTKILAIDLLKIRWMYGATQWGSNAIFIHSHLASMKLLSSFTPAHTHPASLCYLSEYQPKRMIDILHGNELPVSTVSLKLAADDVKMFQVLQVQIEAGQSWHILRRPVLEENKVYYLLGRK